MKKVIYALVVLLGAVGGLVFANRAFNKDAAPKSIPRPLSAAEIKTEREKWEATPEGIHFNNWEASPEGKKVLAGAAKIRHQVRTAANIEAVVTSLALPPGSRLGFGLMVSIDGADYILSLGLLKADELQQLQSLKVNDKIVIRSHVVSYAPKYAFPIVAGDYVERDGATMYKAAFRKGGC